MLFLRFRHIHMYDSSEPQVSEAVKEALLCYQKPAEGGYGR
jgi:hypothetical protein